MWQWLAKAAGVLTPSGAVFIAFLLIAPTYLSGGTSWASWLRGMLALCIAVALGVTAARTLK